MKIDALNMGRMKYQVQLASKEEIINILKKSDIPYQEKVFNLMRSEKIIIDQKFGQYTLREKPIYIEELQRIVNEARKYMGKYKDKYNTKVEHVLNEESAIAFLKQRGYKILKKTYTEI